MISVLVVGSGIAGAAAAWRSTQSGALTSLVSKGPGASVLASGAADDEPWEDLARAARTARTDLVARPLAADVFAFVEALALWIVPRAGDPLAHLATLAGRTRPARGYDRALLDLASIPAGSTVAVPRTPRAAWDADSLAACWNDDLLVKRRKLRFVAFDAELLRFQGEDRIADADLAARHDDPERIAWLAARLKEALSRAKLTPSAVLVGPWLGLDTPRATDLSTKLGIPSGEALAGAGSPAGLRFVKARDRLLHRSNVLVYSGRVQTITLDSTERHHISVEGLEDRLRADRIVLACGGLVSGGIVYDPPDSHAGSDMPERDTATFKLSFAVDPAVSTPPLAIQGARIGVASSMFGPDLDTTAWPTPGRPGALESIGVVSDPDGRVGPTLFAAGDLLEGRARTTLAAVQSGVRAGALASTK